jgi:hypothetical protein
MVPECLWHVTSELLHDIATCAHICAARGCKCLPGLKDGLTVDEEALLNPLAEREVTDGLGDDQ